MASERKLPRVFQRIIENHAERARLLSKEVLSFEDVRLYRALKMDMDNSLRPGAESILKRGPTW